MKNLYALILDVDEISPAQLRRLLAKIENTSSLPAPTLMVNSGSGVHLYFCFAAPVEAYKRRLPVLRTMLGKLAAIYSGHGKMDRHPLIQSFRPAGAQTKLGDVATAYRSGPLWTVPLLASVLGIDPGQWERENVDDKKTAPLEPKKKSAQKDKPAVLPRVKQGDKLFWYCGDRIYQKTDLGNRYMALFGLAIVAYKCRVPKEN